MFVFILGIACGVILLVFVIQNADPTTVQFIAWELTMNRGLFILIVFALGLVVGWVIRSLARRKRPAED